MKSNPGPRPRRRWGCAVAGAAVTLLAAPPVWAHFHTEPSATARGAVVALMAAAVVAPSQALLVCAALFPLGGLLAVLTAADSSLTEPLMLGFLAGWGLWLARTCARPRGADDADGRVVAGMPAVLLPAVLLAVVATASAVVELCAIQPAVAEPWPFVGAALRYPATGFFRDRGTFDAIVSAAPVLEGLGLFAAALVLVGRDRRLAVRLFSMVVAGAAGVAAHNVVRLLTVWMRVGGGWHDLVALWRSLRVSAAFPDPNAAGSYFALALLMSVGLALSSRWDSGHVRGGQRRMAALWLPVIPLVAAALWLSGSRAALLVAALGAVVLVPVALRAPRRMLLGAAAVVVAVLALSAPFALDRLAPPPSDPRFLQQSFDFRVEMSRVAARMFAESPAFGVGIGRFHAMSGAYVDARWRDIAPRENAHNNFLQVLAELGLAGFLPFLALLAVPAARVVRAVRRGERPSAGLGAAAGVLAFALSWLSGHPLLILEVAGTFWVVLGALAGMFDPLGTDASAPSRFRSSAAGWLTAGLIVLVIGSVPFRGSAAALRTGFQNTAIGLSTWKTDGGERFRILEGAAGLFYLPLDATSLRLPIRLSASAGPGGWVDVEVRLDGVAVSLVRIEGREWRDAAFMLPSSAAARPFRTVRVAVVGRSSRPAPDAEGQEVQLGAPTVTRPGGSRRP